MQARNNNIVYALSAVAFLILFNIIDRAPIFHSPLFVNSCARVVLSFHNSPFKKKLQTRKGWTTFSKQTRLRRPRRHRNSPIKTNRTISSPRVRLFAPLNTRTAPVFFFPIILFRLTLPLLFSITYARVLFRLRRRNGRICFRATIRYRECRSAIGTEQRRFYSRKRDWHASSTTTDDDNERFERKFPPAATTTTKSRANGTRDVAREPSFGAFRSFYRSRLGF